MGLLRLEPALSSVVGPRRFLTGVSAGVFTPAQLAPAAWVEARRLWQETDGTRATQAVADGDPVGQLGDLSAGRFYTAAGATARPLLKVVNGRRCLRFDGTNDALLVTSTLGVAEGSATVFAAAVTLASATNRTPVLSLGLSGSASQFHTLEANTFQTAGSLWGAFLDGSTFDSAGATSTSPAVLYWSASTTANGQAVISNSTYQLNGVTKTLTLKNGGGNFATLGADTFALGQFPGVSVFGGMDLYGAVVLSSVPSTADRARLTTYLGSLVGLSL